MIEFAGSRESAEKSSVMYGNKNTFVVFIELIANLRIEEFRDY